MFDQLRVKQQDMSPFIHNQGMAVGAGDLAREAMRWFHGRAVIEIQRIMTAHELDIVLVENGRPLKRRSLSNC